MKKWHGLFIVLVGTALFFSAFAPDSQAVILGSNGGKIQTQLAFDQDATGQSAPVVLVKKGGGKGKKHHGGKKGGKGKGRSEGAGRGNSGESQLRGLDRADNVAGEHGQRGRAKARENRDRDRDDGKE